MKHLPKLLSALTGAAVLTAALSTAAFAALPVQESAVQFTKTIHLTDADAVSPAGTVLFTVEPGAAGQEADAKPGLAEHLQSRTVQAVFAGGTAGDAAVTAESRARTLRRTVEQCDEKDKFEFMLLDASGVILANSSGIRSTDLTGGNDFALALLQGRGNDIYTTTQGERVMAETVLVPYAAGNIAAMRLVTSLRLADEQWWNTVTLAVGLGLLVLLVSVWSGLFFVRSIVRPLGEVETTANRIAHGDLRARLPDTRYDDEIGRLCKAINQMAGDLAETERLKNEFISSVSHELRTPLTSIKGWVETIGNIDDPNNE